MQFHLNLMVVLLLLLLAAPVSGKFGHIPYSLEEALLA